MLIRNTETERKRTLYETLQVQSLNIAITAVLLVLFVFIGATSYLYIYSTSVSTAPRVQHEYREHKAYSSEWMRTHKKSAYQPTASKEENSGEERRSL